MRPVDLTRFDFHVVRFMESEAVTMMSQGEVGAYILLLCKAWMSGKDGSLPNNPKLLEIYARGPVSDLVMSKWTLGAEDRLYNERLSEEYAIAAGRAQAAHEKAMKGASARYGKKDARSIPEASSDDAPMQSMPVQSSAVHAKPVQASPMQSNGAAPQPQTDIGSGNSIGRSNFPSESTVIGKAMDIGIGKPDVCIPHGVSVQNGVIAQPNCSRCEAITAYRTAHNLPGDKPRPPIKAVNISFDEDDLIVMPAGKRVGPASTQTTILARLLYAALPQDRKDEAADKWEDLWAADIQGLLDGGESSAQIEAVLRVLPRLAKVKYVYRGDSFVSMYPKLKADVVKLEKKTKS